jgi:hypothetical protein
VEFSDDQGRAYVLCPWADLLVLHYAPGGSSPTIERQQKRILTQAMACRGAVKFRGPICITFL